MCETGENFGNDNYEIPTVEVVREIRTFYDLKIYLMANSNQEGILEKLKKVKEIKSFFGIYFNIFIGDKNQSKVNISNKEIKNHKKEYEKLEKLFSDYSIIYENIYFLNGESETKKEEIKNKFIEIINGVLFLGLNDEFQSRQEEYKVIQNSESRQRLERQQKNNAQTLTDLLLTSENFEKSLTSENSEKSSVCLLI